MGGVLILLAIAISTLLWADLSNRFIWIVLLVMLGFGAIGWVDDWRKVVHKDPEGMRSREKYFWQSVIGLVAALYLVFSISESSNLKVLELFFSWVRSGFDVNLPPKAGLLLPFIKEVSYPLGVFGFVILTYLVIVGASNAVNLTDGLDGLAIMPVVMVGSALGVFAYVTGSSVYSKYLFFPHIPGSGELLIFCAAMAGAGLAFAAGGLWWLALVAVLLALLATRPRAEARPAEKELWSGKFAAPCRCSLVAPKITLCLSVNLVSVRLQSRKVSHSGLSAEMCQTR